MTAKRRGRAVSGLVAFCALFAGTSPADAARFIGSAAPPGGSQTCFGPALFLQAASTGPSYVVHDGGGVITSWSVHGFGAAAQLKLKTVQRTGVGSYVVRGSSASETLAPAGTSTFETRVPVEAGEEIGLWVPGEAPCNFVGSGPGDQMTYVGGPTPEPALGETYGPTNQVASNYLLNLSAELEPDVDGDGYGDETQNGIPPKTVLTAVPMSRIVTTRKRERIRIEFRSADEATFACTLDGVTRRCSSPFTAVVEKGRHRFSVVATDRGGDVEVKAASVGFKVLRKKR